tara:strand:- start:251 stop:817 length:567 start_codon:yes stop_codon:yes gene_type:complete
MANPMYGQNKADGIINNAEDSGLFTDGNVVRVSTAESAWTNIPVAHGSTDVAAITQPANTVIKDLFIVADTIISTSGVSGDGMDMSIGTAAGGAQIMALCEILDDGGAAVSLQAGTPVYIVENCHGQAANWAAPDTATSEATTGKLVAGLLDSGSSSREIHVRLDVIDANLTSATGSIKIGVVFQHLN